MQNQLLWQTLNLHSLSKRNYEKEERKMSLHRAQFCLFKVWTKGQRNMENPSTSCRNGVTHWRVVLKVSRDMKRQVWTAGNEVIVVIWVWWRWEVPVHDWGSINQTHQRPVERRETNTVSIFKIPKWLISVKPPTCPKTKRSEVTFLANLSHHSSLTLSSQNVHINRH